MTNSFQPTPMRISAAARRWAEEETELRQYSGDSQDAAHLQALLDAYDKNLDIVSSIERDQPIPELQPVFDELKKAVAKFPTWPTDALHAFAVLNEEVGELDKALMHATYEPEKGGFDNVEMEAVQAAAMALRFFLSLHLYAFEPGEQHEQPALNSLNSGEQL